MATLSERALGQQDYPAPGGEQNYVDWEDTLWKSATDESPLPPGFNASARRYYLQNIAGASKRAYASPVPLLRNK